MNPKADFYFTKAKVWRTELELLRKIALDSGLDEVVKWGCPCYAEGDKNVVLIHAFKNYCAFLFFKGALMKDPANILILQTENVQAARQIRFSGLKEIEKHERTLKAYINEALDIERSGQKVELKKTSEFTMPVEFQKALKKNGMLKAAFLDLTPGRQRAYLLYFGSAKQEKTRIERISKFTAHILKGKGLDD